MGIANVKSMPSYLSDELFFSVGIVFEGDNSTLVAKAC
jgi:hypothetical protein